MFKPDTEMISDMQHALAWPKQYRNYYCANVLSLSYSNWMMLVDHGYAIGGAFINDQRDRYFHVTSKGINFLSGVEQNGNR